MASLLSLVVTTLVVGTILNLIDEAIRGPKPFRPIETIQMTPGDWGVIYVMSAVAGGLALLLNVWLDPWACVLLIGVAALALVLLVHTRRGLSFKKYRQDLRRNLDMFVVVIGVSTAISAATLWLLGLINI